MTTLTDRDGDRWVFDGPGPDDWGRCVSFGTHPSRDVRRAEVERKYGPLQATDLLADVKALSQAVALGNGMSLDHEHAQAVIDALVELGALREQAAVLRSPVEGPGYVDDIDDEEM
jgi:hypothetical protein